MADPAQAPSGAEGGGDVGLAVTLDVFSGPLDLLLFLVRRAEVEITSIPIATVADQFIAAIKTWGELDLEVAGDFLVMAATLLELKARTIAPPPDAKVSADEEDRFDDPRADLVRRLLVFRRFKDASEILDRLEADHAGRLPRTLRESIPDDPEEIDGLDLGQLHSGQLFDLYDILMKRIGGARERTVSVDDLPIGQRITELEQALEQRQEATLGEFFAERPTGLQKVTTVMATLECARQRILRLRQVEQFRDVHLAYRPVEQRATSTNPVTESDPLPRRRRTLPLNTWDPPPGWDPKAAHAATGEDEQEPDEDLPENDEHRFLRELHEACAVDPLLERTADVEKSFREHWYELHPELRPPEPPPPPVVEPPAPEPPPKPGRKPRGQTAVAGETAPSPSPSAADPALTPAEPTADTQPPTVAEPQPAPPEPVAASVAPTADQPAVAAAEPQVNATPMVVPEPQPGQPAVEPDEPVLAALPSAASPAPSVPADGDLPAVGVAEVPVIDAPLAVTETQAVSSPFISVSIPEPQADVAEIAAVVTDAEPTPLPSCEVEPEVQAPTVTPAADMPQESPAAAPPAAADSTAPVGPEIEQQASAAEPRSHVACTSDVTGDAGMDGVHRSDASMVADPSPVLGDDRADTLVAAPVVDAGDPAMNADATAALMHVPVGDQAAVEPEPCIEEAQPGAVPVAPADGERLLAGHLPVPIAQAAVDPGDTSVVSEDDPPSFSQIDDGMDASVDPTMATALHESAAVHSSLDPIVDDVRAEVAVAAPVSDTVSTAAEQAVTGACSNDAPVTAQEPAVAPATPAAQAPQPTPPAAFTEPSAPAVATIEAPTTAPIQEPEEAREANAGGLASPASNAAADIHATPDVPINADLAPVAAMPATPDQPPIASADPEPPPPDQPPPAAEPPPPAALAPTTITTDPTNPDLIPDPMPAPPTNLPTAPRPLARRWLAAAGLACAVVPVAGYAWLIAPPRDVLAVIDAPAEGSVLSDRAPLRLRFNLPMPGDQAPTGITVAAGGVPVPGTWRWADAATAEFLPSTSWPWATPIRIAAQDLRSRDGFRLSMPLERACTGLPPAITGASVLSFAADGSTRVRIMATQPIDAVAMATAIQVPGFTVRAEPTQTTAIDLTLVPSDPRSEATLSLPAGFTGTSGPVGLASAWSITLPTGHQWRATTASAETSARGDVAVRLAMTAMTTDVALLAKQITVEPSVPITLAVEAGTVVAHGAFTPGSAYRLRIAPAWPAEHPGTALAALPGAADLAVQVPARPAGVWLDRSGGRIVLGSHLVPGATVRVLAADGTELARWTAAGPGGQDGAWPLPLDRLLSGRVAGTYRIEAQAGDHQAVLPVQVQDADVARSDLLVALGSGQDRIRVLAR